jgi:hypothetical protein
MNRLLRLGLLLLVLSASCRTSPTGPRPGTAGPEGVTLDGLRSDPAWSQARAYVASDRGAKVALQVAELPGVVLLGLDVPEGDTVVARETLHGGELWGDDYVSVELNGAHRWFLIGNAFGTLKLTVDGKEAVAPLQNGTIRSAAHLTATGWRLELAIRLDQLTEPGARLVCSVKRERQQRRYEPSRTAAFPEFPLTAVAGTTPVRAAPMQTFASHRALPVATLDALPADDAAWTKIPSVSLSPERGIPVTSAGFQETRVRAAATADGISFRVECLDANPNAILEVDKEVWRGDSFELSVGVDRFAYPVFLVTPSGKAEVMDVRGGRVKPRAGTRPKGLAVQSFRLSEGGWGAVVTLPLQAVADYAGGGRHQFPTETPWRVQIVRNRPAREALGQPTQTSFFALTHSDTAHCPARFGVLQFLRPGEIRGEPLPRAAGLPPPVLDAAARASIKPGTILERALDARTRDCQVGAEEEFKRIADKAGWEAFAAAQREKLLRCLFPADNGATPARGTMHADSVFTVKGEGFSYVGTVFETFPGLRAPSVLYVPDSVKPGTRLPALIMIPAHHTPSDHTQLQILGANVARCGGIAMAVSSIGTGERGIVDFQEHQTFQRHHFGVQLQLAGEEISGWTAFEVSRAVDYLLTRSDVDPARIALVGAVAGGGDQAAVAAAVDPRIAISIPFNYSDMRLAGSAYDFVRAIPGTHAAGLTRWTIDALVAPRKFIHSQEFAWTDGAEADHQRFQKVYNWLGVPQNLKRQNGWARGDVTHFGQNHRAQMLGAFSEWYEMPSMNVANRLEYTVSVGRDKLNCLDTPRSGEILSAARAAGQLREPLEIARQIAATRLAAARTKNGTTPAAVRSAFQDVLRHAEPAAPATITVEGTWKDAATWESYPVKGLWLALAEQPAGKKGDAGGNAVWLFTPRSARPAAGYPLALGICRDGKGRFLAERGADVKALLAAGISVALVDLSDCGEADCGSNRYPHDPIGDLASQALLLDDSLPAIWLREARTVLRQLVQREPVDPSRIGLWGEGLSAANGRNRVPLLLEEVQFFQATPEPKSLVEPMGELTCLLAALLEQGTVGAPEGKALGVKAVLLRGGMASYFSAFADRHYYFPQDSYLPRMLAAGDIVDLVAALQQAKVAVIAEDLRDAKNRTLDAELLRKEWGAVTPATYATSVSDKATQEFIRKLVE